MFSPGHFIIVAAIPSKHIGRYPLVDPGSIPGGAHSFFSPSYFFPSLFFLTLDFSILGPGSIPGRVHFFLSLFSHSFFVSFFPFSLISSSPFILHIPCLLSPHCSSSNFPHTILPLISSFFPCLVFCTPFPSPFSDFLSLFTLFLSWFLLFLYFLLSPLLFSFLLIVSFHT